MKPVVMIYETGGNDLLITHLKLTEANSIIYVI